MINSPVASVDFVIITALEEEREALLSKLCNPQKLPPVNGDIGVYYHSQLPVTMSDKTQGNYDIIVFSLIDMGRVNASVAASGAIRRWKPRCVLMVGIAGGIKEAGIDLGDILISDQIVDYELQKIRKSKTEVRYSVYKVSPRLMNFVRNFHLKDYRSLLTISPPIEKILNRHIGAIASGDKVIASGHVLRQYQESWPKLIGVEMEAAGVAAAVYQSDLKPDFFMIRGVSDFADNEKDSVNVKQWRNYACEIAAAFTVALLKQGPYTFLPLPLEQQDQDYILVVGASNGEYILTLPLEFKEDRKYTVDSVSLFGGSCINYSMRLMNVKLPVLPIPSVAQDRLGECIQKELLETINRTNKFPNEVHDFVNSGDFFVPEAKTNHSTILIRGDKRTILSESLGQGDFFYHLKKRLDGLGAEIQKRIKTVVIGHIYADSKEKESGKCTKLLIDKFSNAVIFANFGRSQIEHGFNFWKEYLPKISVFQLNLDEIKSLFQVDNERLSLSEIVKSLNRNNVTVVITMDKLGAVCSYRDGRDGLILTLPFKLGKIIDPTGAGDAFGAAIASHLFNNRGQAFSFYDLQKAVREGQFWAAYACRHLGGAADCPNEKEIQDLPDLLKKEGLQCPAIQVIQQGNAETILELLDIAYSPLTGTNKSNF